LKIERNGYKIVVGEEKYGMCGIRINRDDKKSRPLELVYVSAG